MTSNYPSIGPEEFRLMRQIRSAAAQRMTAHPGRRKNVMEIREHRAQSNTVLFEDR